MSRAYGCCHISSPVSKSRLIASGFLSNQSSGPTLIGMLVARACGADHLLPSSRQEYLIEAFRTDCGCDSFAPPLLLMVELLSSFNSVQNTKRRLKAMAGVTYFALMFTSIRSQADHWASLSVR